MELNTSCYARLMTAPVIALWLALFALQAAPPPSSQPAQTAAPQDQQPAPAPSSDDAAPLHPVRRPCRNPDPTGNYRIGCGVTAPKPLHIEEPQFSELARKQKVGGDVVLSLTVDTQGNPTNIKITRSLADKVDPKFRKAALSLDDKAIEAVSKYHFAPATYQGSPVAVQVNVDVNFQIF